MTEAMKAIRREMAEAEAARGGAKRPPRCKHRWEEQPGEPPVDVCVHCGERRE